MEHDEMTFLDNLLREDAENLLKKLADRTVLRQRFDGIVAQLDGGQGHAP